MVVDKSTQTPQTAPPAEELEHTAAAGVSRGRSEPSPINQQPPPRGRTHRRRARPQHPAAYGCDTERAQKLIAAWEKRLDCEWDLRACNLPELKELAQWLDKSQRSIALAAMEMAVKSSQERGVRVTSPTAYSMRALREESDAGRRIALARHAQPPPAPSESSPPSPDIQPTPERLAEIKRVQDAITAITAARDPQTYHDEHRARVDAFFAHIKELS